MDLDQVATELYDAAPEEFVGLRKERAAEARAAGDRELAKTIGALRKPTRSAWIVNLLSGQAGEELSGLLELGAALAQAQQQLAGDDLRRLAGRRQAAISSLVQRGRQLAEVRGHTPTEATLREVSDTLQAALSDPEIADEVRVGRLISARTYGGFGGFGDFGGFGEATSAQPAAAEQETAAASDPEQASAEDDQEAEHERRLGALDAAQRSLDQLRGRSARASDQLEAAEATARRRAERLRELESQLDRVRKEVAGADADVTRLRQQVAELDAAEQAAEDAVAQALTELTGE